MEHLLDFRHLESTWYKTSLRPAASVHPANVTITEFTNESGTLQLHSAQKVCVTVLCSNTTVVHMGLAIKNLNKFNKIKSPFLPHYRPSFFEVC